jgi:hypothetical protein
MAAGFRSILQVAGADGPPITVASAASCLPVTAKYTFPPNAFVIPSTLRIHANGRISNVVTTPGTARIDIRLGGTVIFDTGALILNQVAKVTLPWWFDCYLTCRAIGATANFMGMGRFQSEAIVGSPLASVGGSGSLLSAVSGGPETAPAVGGNVDITIANAFDMFFTQTVTTGSFTVHQLFLEGLGLAIP